MSRVLGLIGWLVLAGGSVAAADESVAAVREDFERLADDGLSAPELADLATRTLELARRAERNRDLWSAMTVLADLVREGPLEEARGVRTAALALLAERFQDTRRWAIFVGGRFQPQPDRVPEALMIQTATSLTVLLVMVR